MSQGYIIVEVDSYPESTPIQTHIPRLDEIFKIWCIGESQC